MRFVALIRIFDMIKIDPHPHPSFSPAFSPLLL